uniref:Uncharacterized sensor-like histidine kinase ycf26 n=1 Tax=Ceramothamnion japonicum TaxID=218448 RepID=A0A1C9CDB5_CERJP|nr:two component sensor kinase [Ceramium japonicum]AOM66376.1 two component sensor kinase [Ceramium japonicum]
MSVNSKFVFKSIANINWQIRIIILIILLLSLLISGFAFWSLTILQKESLITNNRFCKDLGTLFAYNILNFIDNNNEQQLLSFIEEIYISTSSIRYILFFKLDGSLFFSLPVYKNNVQDILQLHQALFKLETEKFLFNTPLLNHNNLFNDNITNVVLPLNKNGVHIGSLDLGISSNPTYVSTSLFISKMSIVIFISIWALVLLFAIFHFFILAKPIGQLIYVIECIGLGDFTKRLNISSYSYWHDLVISFNGMIDKLQYYEKQHINRLILEKNKLESIASIISDGIILVDLDLRVLFINRIARKSFNCLNSDMIGHNLTNCLPLYIIESLLPILNNLIKLTYLDSLNYSYEELVINIDYDSKKNYRFLLSVLIDNHSKILIGIAIIIQDISREVKLNKAKNQFISNVSHELRTPLCNIGSFLETLLDYSDSLNDKQQKHFLTIANNETQRLSRLVNDILDLSRLESNFKYDLSSINLINLLNYILNTSYIIASKHNIKLILEVDPNIICVRGHESSFVQIISNLLSNAIKFTNDYGQIIIRVYSVISLPMNSFLLNNKKLVKLIRVEIIDEGIGIDNIEQKIIFDRFVRIEDNIHTLQGTGLGLSIVKNILRKYDTDIFLDSYVFVGTILWFDLFQI